MSPATLWDPAAARRRYVRQLLWATAHKLASGDPNMVLTTVARYTRLDATGRPIPGTTVDLGPTTVSITTRIHEDPTKGESDARTRH